MNEKPTPTDGSAHCDAHVEEHARRHWREILWRESACCRDPEVATLVREAVPEAPTFAEAVAMWGAAVAIVGGLWAAGFLTCLGGWADSTAWTGAMVGAAMFAPLTGIFLTLLWRNGLTPEIGRPRSEARGGMALLRSLMACARVPDRPDPILVPPALREACRASEQVASTWEEPLGHLDECSASARPLSEYVRDLASDDWRTRWVATMHLARCPAESVPVLLARVFDGPLEVRRPIFDLLRLLRRRFWEECQLTVRRSLCAQCLVRPEWHVLDVPHLGQLEVYGCRSCHSMDHLEPRPGPTVCVLDSRSDQERVETGRELWVNWLVAADRTRFEGVFLFDFDRVEIARATDDEVQHFLVDIVNDTDKLRRKRYPTMTCRVSPDCTLSANTLAALKGAFGKVEVGSVPTATPRV